MTGNAAGNACRWIAGTWSTTAGSAGPTATSSVSRSPLRTPFIGSGPIQSAGPVRWASKAAASVVASTPAGRPDSLSLSRTVRSPSASRSRGEAMAKPTGAAGSPARPKGGQCGEAGTSGAPRPLAELAMGANSSRWPSRTMLASRATRARPTTVGRTGANSCSTLVASLPAENSCGKAISTAAAPFLSSKTRCAWSGCGPRGAKPSTRCIW